MILVDLQKVFDTFDYDDLLEKIKYFGFWTSIINCFQTEGFGFLLLTFFLILEH